MYHHGRMKLSEYINTFPRHQREAVRKRIAAKCGVSPALVRSMANGSRPIRSAYFRAIHLATDGKVGYDDMLPDQDIA